MAASAPPPPPDAFRIDDTDDDLRESSDLYDPSDGSTVIDDGLSVCDEEGGGRRRITSAQAAAERANAKAHRRLTVFLLGLTFLASAVVTTVRYYRPPGARTRSAANDDVDLGGNQLTEVQNEERLRRVLEYLVTEDVSPPETLDYDPKFVEVFGPGGSSVYTPQYRAAVWIARHDNYRIQVPSPEDMSPVASGEEYSFLQRYSLAVLFFATGGLEHWLWKINFLRGWHECGWFDGMTVQGLAGGKLEFGVLCDGAPNFEVGETIDAWRGKRTVTGVSLPPLNNMKGTLPEEVRHLKYLKALHVQHNKGIAGPIPFQYGWLKHMTERESFVGVLFEFVSHACSFLTLGWAVAANNSLPVALMYNNLEKKIPRTFAQLTKLKVLRMEVSAQLPAVFLCLSCFLLHRLCLPTVPQENQLTGDSTDGDLNFANDLTDLTFLSLDYNYGITGTIPDLSNLSKLRILALANTGLYGTIPTSLGKLTNLKQLFLDDCAFDGSTEVVQGMTWLTHVYLEDNKFNDIVDDTFFAESRDLVHLDASNCSFAGFVPGHLFNLSRLEVLDMSNNGLRGELPAEAMAGVKDTRLKFLSLHTNNITGSIPPGVGNLVNLTTLDLSTNEFVGEMPEEIQDLPRLQILFLGRNDYTPGPVPTWLRNMTSLTELSLKGSKREESIPAWLGDLSGLTFLDLGENNLTDTIPPELGYLSELMVLILNQNRLQGSLGLGSLTKLETILIDDNSLTGNTNEMCLHKIEHFISDCGKGAVSVAEGNGTAVGAAELDCACCTLCCRDEDTTCNDAEWLGNHAGIWEYGYDRAMWNFEEGAISPLIDYNFQQAISPWP
ncbi:hypothetical protein ACHAWF_017357 [Thalassiosira exigua]